MLIRDRFTDYPGENPLVGEDVLLYRTSDNALLATVATDAGGWVEFSLNGNPGPVYYTCTANGETRRVEGGISQQNGHLYSGEVHELLGLFTPGVIRGMAVSAPGGMFVQVATGIAYDTANAHSQRSAQTLAIGANASGNPRYDMVFVSVANASHTRPWETELVVVQGVPASSPTEPSFALSNRVGIPLARVLVNSGASSISTGTITDRRTFSVPTIGDNSVTLGKLAPSGAASGNVPVFNGTDWVPGAGGGSGSLPAGALNQILLWSVATGAWGKGQVDHLVPIVASKAWTGDQLMSAGSTVTRDTLSVTPPAGSTYTAFFLQHCTLRGINGGGTCKAQARVIGTGGSLATLVCRTVGGVSNRALVFGSKSGIVGDGTTAFTVTASFVQDATTDTLTIEPGQIFMVLIPHVIPKVVL